MDVLAPTATKQDHIKLRGDGSVEWNASSNTAAPGKENMYNVSDDMDAISRLEYQQSLEKEARAESKRRKIAASFGLIAAKSVASKQSGDTTSASTLISTSTPDSSTTSSTSSPFLTLDSGTLERLLSSDMKSIHADLVGENESSIQAREALYNYYETKESMARQLNDMHEISVKAHKCSDTKCDAISEYPLGACRLKGHQTQQVTVMKRYFHCSQCHYHLSILDRKLPKHSCHQCGANVWKKAGMIPMVNTITTHAPECT